jgi:hypothetical protein
MPSTEVTFSGGAGGAGTAAAAGGSGGGVFGFFAIAGAAQAANAANNIKVFRTVSMIALPVRRERSAIVLSVSARLQGE